MTPSPCLGEPNKRATKLDDLQARGKKGIIQPYAFLDVPPDCRTVPASNRSVSHMQHGGLDEFLASWGLLLAVTCDKTVVQNRHFCTNMMDALQ